MNSYKKIIEIDKVKVSQDYENDQLNFRWKIYFDKSNRIIMMSLSQQ